MEKEYMLDEGAFLVSETDERGIVLFANDDFCKIANFTREELVGQNHNIVRHNDMPRIAFKGLWDTIKAGKVWTGVVKNKRNGGGYYWVYATAYQMNHRNGKPTYMSCRRIASRDEIARAEKLYETLRGQ